MCNLCLAVMTSSVLSKELHVPWIIHMSKHVSTDDFSPKLVLGTGPKVKKNK